MISSVLDHLMIFVSNGPQISKFASHSINSLEIDFVFLTHFRLVLRAFFMLKNNRIKIDIHLIKRDQLTFRKLTANLVVSALQLRNFG